MPKSTDHGDPASVVGWAVFLAGLPFAHLLYHDRLDIWHAQTLWAQAGLLGLTAVALSDCRSQPANRPLGIWLAWVAGLTLWQWTATIQAQRQYPFPILQGVMHLVFAWLFYQAAVTTWTPAVRASLWRAIAWSGALVVVYGWLQVAKLDQFYLNIDRKVPDADLLVGTLGNPTHFAGHLALCLPFWLQRPGWGWKGVILAALGLLGLSRSVTALLAVWVLGTLWLAWTWPQVWGWIVAISVGLLAVVSGVTWWQAPGFFNPQGREAAWTAFWRSLVQRPISGWGLGAVMEASRAVTEGPLHKWRHVHCEPFQVWLETGAIGLGLLGWMLTDWARRLWQLPKTEDVRLALSVGVVFALLSLTSFPAHLWVLGSFGLLAYALVYRLTLEQEAFA